MSPPWMHGPGISGLKHENRSLKKTNIECNMEVMRVENSSSNLVVKYLPMAKVSLHNIERCCNIPLPRV